MREIVHIQAGQCGNQIGAKVSFILCSVFIDLSDKLLILLFRECCLLKRMIIISSIDLVNNYYVILC